MTAKTFDPYEYVAVIAPGAVVALGLATEWPELRSLLADRGLTVGASGYAGAGPRSASRPSAS
jgi:hypothetical protein